MGLFEFNDVGIDLGTANVLVYVKGKGIVLREPSVVAIDRISGELLAVGEDAKVMLGRTPGNIIAVRPLRDGVISNFHDTERMLRYFLRKVIGRRLFFKPRVIVCVPSGVTEVEKRSVIDATEEAGARHTCLIEEPLAAAIGAGLDIASPYGHMVLDIGGGTSDIAVLSLGGAVITGSVKCAGYKFNDAVIKYMKKKHNVLLGERTAEEIKINIGTAVKREDELFMEVTGRNIISGMPKTVTLSSNETVEAFEEPLNIVFEAIHSVLEQTPPELASDIAENGICMTGGGSLLHGLDTLLTQKTNAPCYVAEDATSCVAIGTGKALEDIQLYSSGAVYDYRRGDYYERL
jgi:rod shape-determining protein MreB and related proteins